MNMEKFIDDLDLGEGDTVRGYCPDCGGKNTFTASKTGGAVVYNCYKLGCKIQGIQTVGMTAADIEARMRDVPKPKPKLEAMNIPEHIVRSGTGLDEFKDKWNLWDQGLMYDLKDNRVVFPIFYKGIMLDAGCATLARLTTSVQVQVTLWW